MEVINTEKMLQNLKSENYFMGTPPQLINSKIIFRGKGNILVCKPSVKIINSTITFYGDNSLGYLCESKFDYRLMVHLYNHSVLAIGKHNYMNGYAGGGLNILLSERKHCLIGSGGLFSYGIWIRNAEK